MKLFEFLSHNAVNWKRDYSLQIYFITNRNECMIWDRDSMKLPIADEKYFWDENNTDTLTQPNIT